MITILLLAAAILVAVGGSALRSRRAADPTASDTSVLMIDFSSAAIVVILLIAGAIDAAVVDEVDGAELVAGAVLTVIAAAVTGSSVVRLVLAAGGIPTRADNHDDDAPSGDVPPLRGGRIIGVLERTGIAACLLLGWPEGIPVILAVKSLARFSELRAPHASEQFILGTFASVLWSCAVAGIGYLLGT
ncbi:hypothetical protein JVX90_07970 [Gordonia sp. PDNC005]|uniref:hypothetical protein n=1 Tax=unclassified Gordonia (in: high G+C Gram-positive bacteria) TaxID=2657482 RepID=UPI001966C541|nr:hypothetical protein [Gordonia sp. PDNC005]QRY64106.1 hypothetical protein JVX90_07970 [Gordonia sp. PDNC005]